MKQLIMVMANYTTNPYLTPIIKLYVYILTTLPLKLESRYQ